MTEVDPAAVDLAAFDRRRLILAPAIVLLAATLLTIALWVFWVVRYDPWVAHNDFATMRLSLERMLDGDVPTVGVYSRLGVYHPGPLREWVFVVPYALGGGRASTLPATAMVLNLTWLVACCWLVARCGAGGCRIAVAAGATLLVVGLGPNLASPWNPHLAILPLYVALWSVTLLWRGKSRNLPLAVLAVTATSFAGQLHASALPVAGVLLAAAILLPLARARPRPGWHALTPLAVGLLLWSGVLIDLRHLGSSNLVGLAQAGSGSTLGVGDAIGQVSRLLWPSTPATGLSIRPSAASMMGFSRLWVVVVVAGSIATAWLAFRRTKRNDVDETGESVTGDNVRHELELVWRAAVVAFAGLAISVLTIAAFAPPPFRYLFGPLQAVAVFALAAVLCWPLHLVSIRLPERFSLAALGVLAVVSVAMFVVVPVDDHESAARRELGIEAAVTQFLESRPEWSTVAVIGLDMSGASAQDEVAVIVYREGRDVRSNQFGLHLSAPDGSEPMFAVAMGASFECLVADPAAHQLLTGVVGESAPIGVFAIDAGLVGRFECHL